MAERIAGNRRVIVPLALDHKAHKKFSFTYKPLWNITTEGSTNLSQGCFSRNSSLKKAQRPPGALELGKRRQIKGQQRVLNRKPLFDTVRFRMIRGIFLLLISCGVATCLYVTCGTAWGAADQLEEIQREQMRFRQQ